MPTIVFGGTFDPPHLVHLVMAECARHELGAEKVLWVPAGDPYLKRSERPEALPAAAAHRLAMVRLAIAGNPAFVVDDREIRRAGPSYTVDTLEELTAEGHAGLVLLLGSDAAATLGQWRDLPRLLELAQIAVVPRAEGAADIAREAERHVIRLRTAPALAVSSTMVRERIAAGLPVRYLVPEGVEAYIRETGLYGPQPDRRPARPERGSDGQGGDPGGQAPL